jgi:hypothetical protein
MHIVRIAAAAALFATQTAAHSYASFNGDIAVAAKSSQPHILAMSDGGAGNGAGSGWVPFPDKDGVSRPKTPQKSNAARPVEETTKTKGKQRK